MSDKEAMSGITVPVNCVVCGSSLKLTLGVSFFDQIIEKANKDAIDSHNQKQTILKMQRELDRQKKLIGELYTQVHGRSASDITLKDLVRDTESEVKISFEPIRNEKEKPIPYRLAKVRKLKTSSTYGKKKRK